MLDKKSVRVLHHILGLVLIYFIFIIFLPSVYILKYFSNFAVYSNPLIIKSVLFSFFISLVVTLINLTFGIPLAWVLSRSRKRIVRWIDNLVDLSLVMPTAALGFSIYLYWGTGSGLWKLFGFENGLISRGAIMIILLHVVFTLPYMIRSVAAAIQQLEIQYEEAALTLGAGPFTFFRTIAMPLFKDGVINGSILSFTRSLSETGATMMVAGIFMTAPVLIINLKDRGDLPTAAGASILLIISAIVILLAAKLLLGERRINLSAVFPKIENRISKTAPFKNIIIFSFFFIFIFLPSIQIVFFSLSGIKTPYEFVLLLRTLGFSVILSILVTVINFIFSVPFSYIIARNIYGLGKIMDTLSEIVLLVPTGALGLSLAFFWKQFIPSDLFILVLAHLSFTFPLLVKPVTSAIKDISSSQEEAAYTLGAGSGQTLMTILLPQIKPAIIAGCIMAFMRSLSETGATLAVTRNIKTVTVMIVDQFNSGNLTDAAFTCTILFLIALTLLFFLKKVNSRT